MGDATSSLIDIEDQAVPSSLFSNPTLLEYRTSDLEPSNLRGCEEVSKPGKSAEEQQISALAILISIWPEPQILDLGGKAI